MLLQFRFLFLQRNHGFPNDFVATLICNCNITFLSPNFLNERLVQCISSKGKGNEYSKDPREEYSNSIINVSIDESSKFTLRGRN